MRSKLVSLKQFGICLDKDLFYTIVAHRRKKNKYMGTAVVVMLLQFFLYLVPV